MASNSEYKGKILTLAHLLGQQRVEVPIIQRDYAQGRIDKKEIRSNFLAALHESIVNQRAIKLDFIYGSNSKNVFQPLDGQQRLTTLFLLHWYGAAKEGKLDDSIKKVLSRFSYETRITSRDFCNALINNSINITNEPVRLSERIIDSNWFFLSWKLDPTIDSMLRTIDDIDLLFSGVEDLWSRLTSPSDLISFYYVELENIGLTDDLYIKMNARGKLLTPFENFKASFQKLINENAWEAGKPFNDSFACKIDTNYTDYFWNHFRKANMVDDAFMRVISSVAMLRQALERPSSKAEERVQIITLLQEQPNQVRPEHFSELGFKYLVEVLDEYQNAFAKNIDLSLPFPLWRHQPRKTILSEIAVEDNVYSNVQINSAPYSQKALFFAQSEYLRRIKFFNAGNFRDWMRVIRNIISRADIDKDGNRPDIIRSPQSFDGGVNLINELAEGCENIYVHLSENPPLKSQFAKDQVEEEKIKARLIIDNPKLKELIFELEDNDLLRGRINFALYCVDYDNSKDNLDEELLSKTKQVFATYFNQEDDVSNALRRAMLTIEANGKYEFYNYWWSFWNVGEANKRRFFDKFREIEWYIYSDFREYFKKLILQLIEKDFAKIIQDFQPPLDMPNWKKRLIKEPDLLDNDGRSHYVAIPEDNSFCYLLKSKRPRDLDGAVKIL